MIDPSSWPQIKPVPRSFDASETTILWVSYKFWDLFVLICSARTFPSSKPYRKELWWKISWKSTLSKRMRLIHLEFYNNKYYRLEKHFTSNAISNSFLFLLKKILQLQVCKVCGKKICFVYVHDQRSRKLWMQPKWSRFSELRIYSIFRKDTKLAFCQ